jgi:hypothetical protein
MAKVILRGFQRKPATSVIAANETALNRRTVALVAALCATAAWAPANAQTIETSVVKVPEDIVYKGPPGSTATRHLVRRFFAARPLRRSHQISTRPRAQGSYRNG